MTVGQLKAVLDRSGLSDDAPVYFAMYDVSKRDGSFEIMPCQIEAGNDDGLTCFFDTGVDHPPVLVGMGPTADTDIFENDSE